MNRALDLVGYQAVWFAAVIGAGRGSAWPGVLAATAFVAWHFGRAPAHRLRLGAAALAAGCIVDGTLAATGLIDYAANGVLPAPAWILALWVAFSMTLTASLDLLQRRPLIAALAGAVGAPLAYAGAAAGWQAVAFGTPAWIALGVLGAGWALALPLLARLAASAAAVRAATSLRVGLPP